MQEKLFEIHGFLTQQGGSLGQTKDFKYFEVLIPELQFPSSSVAAVSLDILVTILIARDSTPANVGKQATRKIKAVVVRASDKIITVTKSVEGIHVDAEMELAQTNLLVSNNKLFLAVTGTANGTLFSCSASVRYVATGEKETPKHRSVLEKIETGTIVEYPNSSIDVDHNDLDGRSADDCHPGAAISYDNSTSGLTADDVQAAIDELDSTLDDVVDITTTVENIITATSEPTGFENRTSSTLSYDAGTRQFTLTAVTDTYYWIKGERFVLIAGSSVVSTAHADTSDTYFFYFNASNVATVTDSFWNLEITCPIAFALYDTYATPAQGILCDERHGMVMDWATHAHLHFSKGSFVRSGFAIDTSSYVLGSSTANDKKFRIYDGYFVDEDITLYHDDALMQEALVGDRKYTTLYRQGTNGDWTWSKDESFPIIWDPTVGDYNPYYNQFVAGAPGTWQLTKITTTNKWFNTFVCVVNSTDTSYKLVSILGQTEHTSLSAAEEESILELEWGSVPFQEITPIYQVSWRRGPYGGPGNPHARIDAVQKIVGVSITLSGLLASNHASLAGRDLPNQHPASAISYENVDGSSNPQGDLFAIDMQNAVEEIQDLANHGPQTGSITRVGGEVTEVEYVREFGTTTIALTRDGDGNVVTIESTYDNGVDTPIVRTKTLTYDVDGNLESWEIV